MSDPDVSALRVADLYRRHRLDDQLGYYRVHTDLCRQARNQARFTAATLLFLASVAGALGSANVADGRAWWALAATVFGASATALTAYEAVYGFDRLSRDYEKAVAGLVRLETMFPGEPCTLPADGPHVVRLLDTVEKALIGEVDRWATKTAQFAAGEEQPEQPESPREPTEQSRG